MDLYPLKFEPILKKIIWGGDEICKFKQITLQQSGIGESWEISGVENDVSVVAEGTLKGKTLDSLIAEYKDRLVGSKVYGCFGATFPLLIKFIDAHDNLSIQVHPNDELAKERHNSFGKTELWYVIDTRPGAFLYSGFAKQIPTGMYEQTIDDNTFVDYLAKHEIKRGDVFFLPAGRVHAIGAGTLIAEIQQTSNITYRIYDYNRKDADGNKRELHTELAKDAIDYNIYDSQKTEYKANKNHSVKLESCKYFTTNLLDLDKPVIRDYSKLDSFVIYICMGGGCNIEDDKGNKLFIRQGESILIPAETISVNIKPDKDVLLMETYV